MVKICFFSRNYFETFHIILNRRETIGKINKTFSTKEIKHQKNYAGDLYWTLSRSTNISALFRRSMPNENFNVTKIAPIRHLNRRHQTKNQPKNGKDRVYYCNNAF